MKNENFFLTVVLYFIAAYAFAHGANDLILHGIIVDNACAEANKNNLADFVKTHPKTCMLKPDCMKSGYSIYAEEGGKLYKFDEASNGAVAEFLKGPDNRTDVVIIAEKNGELLMIESIKNRRIVK